MPALLLIEAGEHAVATGKRGGARRCPRPAFLLSGRPVGMT
jgi:hypothetical protein